MGPHLGFIVALGIAAGSAGLIIAVLRRPLLRVVTDLCGTEDRGRFWTAYTGVMIVLAPVLAVSLAAPGAAFDDPHFLQRCVFWSALALIAALAIFGFALWQPSHRLFQARAEDRMRQAERAR